MENAMETMLQKYEKWALTSTDVVHDPWGCSGLQLALVVMWLQSA